MVRSPVESPALTNTAEPTDSKMLRDFFLGFVKVHVLHHATRGPIYGVWFLGELGRHGYQLSPGTLYPLLHSLEAAGYLEREERVVEGKVRKYYGITALGEQALREARVRIRELVDELLEGSEEHHASEPAKVLARTAAR